MRQILSNILHYLVTIIFILMFFAFFDTSTQVSQLPNYKQYVNDNIERYGGLTTTAMTNINEYSKAYNDNRFSLVSTDIGKKKGFGEIVNYQIKQQYEIKFLINKKVTKYTSGQAVSEVR